MVNTLESSIQSIVTRAAAEIAQTVRASIAAEINRAIGFTSVAKAPRATAGKRALTPRRGVAEADLQKVLDYIGKNPGKRSEEIQKALHLDGAYGKKVLAKLRETKAVKTKGERRATTYAVA
jgi:hypothetical protein